MGLRLKTAIFAILKQCAQTRGLKIFQQYYTVIPQYCQDDT
jgi:hypothetical protein